MTRRRRNWLIFVIALVALGLTAWTMRARIGMRLFERVVERNAGTDASKALPDGLHVYVCGSGSPLPDAERAGPCLALLAGNRAYVFDSGSGSTRKLLRMGFPIEKLRAIYLTHLHSDHIDGLGELMLQAWIGGGLDFPVAVNGPAGASEVVAGLNQAYRIDSTYRIAHHGETVARPKGYGAIAGNLDLGPNQTSAVAEEFEGGKITVFRVTHDPVKPAYGYRIDYNGRSVVISGDTIYSANLVGVAKGADLLFHEALNARMVAQLRDALDAHGRRDAAKIMADIPGYHASPADAARAAQTAKARALVLYHLVPSVPPGLMESAFLGDAGKAFDGTLKVARDGMLVSLPAGSKAIDFDQVL